MKLPAQLDKEFDQLMKDPRIDGFQGNNQEQIKTEYKRLRDTCQGHLKVIKDLKE